MIRFATEKDIKQVNVIRKEVNDLHVKGEPKIFKPGFCKEMQDYVKNFIGSQDKMLIVYENEDNLICAYAMIEDVTKEETPYRYKLHFLEIQEIGTLNNHQGKGYASALLEKAKEIAKKRNIENIELNMWSFNKKALNFYNKKGFETYRKYLRISDF